MERPASERQLNRHTVFKNRYIRDVISDMVTNGVGYVSAPVRSSTEDGLTLQIHLGKLAKPVDTVDRRRVEDLQDFASYLTLIGVRESMPLSTPEEIAPHFYTYRLSKDVQQAVTKSARGIEDHTSREIPKIIERSSYFLRRA